MRVETLGPWTIHVATSRTERRHGLLGRDRLDPHEALWLPRCRSVHTFGMRFGIDVVLLDRDDLPIDVRGLSPGRILLPRRRVRHIVEVAAGWGEAFSAALGGRTTLADRDTDRPPRT